MTIIDKDLSEQYQWKLGLSVMIHFFLVIHCPSRRDSLIWPSLERNCRNTTIQYGSYDQYKIVFFQSWLKDTFFPNKPLGKHFIAKPLLKSIIFFVFVVSGLWQFQCLCHVHMIPIQIKPNAFFSCNYESLMKCHIKTYSKTCWRGHLY